MPVPGSAVLGIFPKGQMVSLGSFAQSSCHWQEMTNISFREVALKWGLGVLGYGLQLVIRDFLFASVINCELPFIEYLCVPDSRHLYIRELSLLLVKVWPWTSSIHRSMSEMQNPRDFPSGPVVKNPCNAGDVS